MDSKIIVVWHGHSCFTLSADGYTLALDPYDNSLDGYAPLQLSANEVLCSHGHHDHAWLPAVTLLDPPASSPFQVRAIRTWHDDCQGADGETTWFMLSGPLVKRWSIAATWGIFLTKDQIMQIGTCDVLMVPVGGFYTIDAGQARQVADQLSASIVIPMHYRFGEYGIPVIGEVEEFLTSQGAIRFIVTRATA